MTPSPLDRRTLLRRSAASLALAASLGHILLAPSVAAQNGRDLADLVAGNTAFAFDLYHQLRTAETGNLIVSPLSISLALAMTFAGARGETERQMADVLGFGLPQDVLHEAFGFLVSDLIRRGTIEKDDEQGTGESGLRVANTLWGEHTYPFDPAFASLLDNAYDAGLQQVDFIGDPEAARAAINAWVEEQTEDRIQDIVPEGAITVDTRLVLANAIWFYGAWRTSFEEHRTRDDDFHLADGTTVSVPFMIQRETFAYAEGEGMQIIDLPYDSNFTMTIILPDDGKLGTVEESLDADVFQDAIDMLERTEVVLHLPNFEFEYAASLADPLQALGIADAFEPDRADFTGMIEGSERAPDDNLSISDVLHKAFITVDEEGTEAAAATVVMMEGEGMPAEDPPEIRIDRPFLVVIRDTDTGTVLFLGRVTDPS